MSRHPIQREDLVALSSLLGGIALGLFAAAVVTAGGVRWPTTAALVVVGSGCLVWGFRLGARAVDKR